MATREPVCDAGELRKLFLFERLTDEQLAWLCRHGRVERVGPGDVYDETDLVTSFYVLLEGELVISRRAGGEDLEINRISQPGAYAGAWRTLFGDRVGATLDNTLRATRPSRLYVLTADKFGELMAEWFPMPAHMFEGLYRGMKNTQEAISQRERLLALGSLAAGLTHELNNPAAAAMRATAALREHIAGLRRPPEVAAALPDPDQAARARSMSPLEASDREDELTGWLEDHGITDGWRMAPTFAQAGLTTDRLETLADTPGLEPVLNDLSHTLDITQLVTEIDDATARISALVTAAQHYSQMDRAYYHEVDVHELLDSTLLVLNSKIGADITVTREYDLTLPVIPLYAAEMNQVWTNLIDNALDAMPGHGTLTLRTSRDGDRLLVEIADTGAGVPPEIKTRIFEPFFTTKPVGSGTGLGLDLSWRTVVDKHHGDLSFHSQPGETCFQVRLPFAGAPKEEQLRRAEST